MEVELVAGALTMRESVCFQNMIEDLGIKEGLKCVPFDIDNTSALQ